MEIMVGLIGLLFATVIMVAIGDRWGLPWPVLLTILAAGAIFIPGIPQVHIDSELMLPVFIPPLLWALARRTSWAQIRHHWRSIMLLSVLLVLVTAFAVGVTAYLLVPALSLAGAIVIGAAVSPPDPVAVDAVAEPAGVPRRLTNTLQTEGLFNDAASILVFNLGLSVLVQGNSVTWWQAILTFIYSTGVAILIGWLIGISAAWLTGWMTSSVARNAFTWVIPFATFLAAEAFHASGVVAIVIAAIEFNSRVDVEAEDRLSGTAFWEIVEMLFTGVAFGLIGIMVRDAIVEVGSDLWNAVWLGLVLSLVAIAVRGLWFLAIYRVNKHFNRRCGAPLRLQEVLLLTWAGMRGLVTLALVLSIPVTSGFGLYHELPVIALVVVFITMVLPGLTLPWLMKRLSLDAGPDAFGDLAREELVNRARRVAYEHILSRADEIGQGRAQAMMTRFDELSHLEDFEDERLSPEKRRERLLQIRSIMQETQLEALEAAQKELLSARRERNVDPAILDEVLFDVDRQIIGAKAKRAHYQNIDVNRSS
ncbi:MAG: cation:proton antiporter [Corynebacterium sp.]|uniref:cation:proton antiporter n=1 Tax=Corynebacterium sp. TaxID=1720 RepID=UPI0026DB6269|nr:cation:proton antiporter [Corynebacterium sp.]MDO5098263.1 cation:proton antiporter [Corynebacterium sp.]